jgi:hypothetical protein
MDVPDHERVLAEVRDPDGWVVVLLERIWAGKIAADHRELAGYQEEVLATVSGPDHVEPDPRVDRRRLPPPRRSEPLAAGGRKL